MRLAQVPRVAGGAQQRAGDAEAEQRVGVDGGDAAQALEHDLVLVDQLLELVEALRELLGEGARLLHPAGRDVLGDAASAWLSALSPDSPRWSCYLVEGALGLPVFTPYAPAA